ncbi:MAG: hypothetical protein QW275_02825 [Candidatus Anstonellaceae archaeon]
MRLDENKVALVSAIVAAFGIGLLFLLSETPIRCSIAQASLLLPNTLVEIGGSTANITSGKFSLCSQGVCVSVRHQNLPAADLLEEGGFAVVLGRVKEYRGRKYIQAEKISPG